jgi:hypothetical protein
MMRRILLSLAATAVVLVSFHTAATAQARQQIQLSQLEVMFADMRAKAPWNVDGPLLWGFFFFDPSAAKLREAASELQASGYKVVSLAEVPGRRIFRLHVEKVEIHSPQTLHERNLQFYALAQKHKLASYDGMDVGPPPK